MKLVRYIRYIILVLFLWYFPAFLLAYFGSTLGTISSYLSFGLVLLYLIIEKEKGGVIKIFVVLTLLYFALSGFNLRVGEVTFFINMVKCLILIVGGSVIMRKASLKEIYIIILIGVISIVVNATLFPLQNANFYPTFGRFSGFYLNPNFAGAISLIGFALSFGIPNKKLKFFGQFIFSIGGFFTLSRYFLLMWVLMNGLSVLINRKNLIVPVMGAVGLLIIITFADKLSLDPSRFLAYQSVLGGDQVDTKTLSKDSRDETWSAYYNLIYEKPFLGDGYKAFQMKRPGLPGVHNTYLMVLGESGVIPFLILIGISIFFLKKAFESFRITPHLSFLAIVLVTALLVTHNYFDNYALLLLSIYLFIQFKKVPTQN